MYLRNLYSSDSVVLICMSLFSKAHTTLNKLKIDQAKVCVLMYLANDSLETIAVLIITLCTMTASDMRMHHVLIILALTFIQGHTGHNNENIKYIYNCSRDYFTEKLFKQCPSSLL